MGIDYVINMDCNVKKALTQDLMVKMIKDRRLAKQIMYEEGIRAGKSNEELRDMKFKFALPTGALEQTEEITLDELMDRTKALRDLEAHCKSCGLSMIGHYDTVRMGRTLKVKPFACCDHIDYPVSAKAEEWLAGIARSALAEGGVRKIMIDYILEENQSGADVGRLRGHPQGTFYELRKPLEIVADKGFLHSETITTDQLLTVIFGAKTMSIAHMWGLLMLSGAFGIKSVRPEGGAGKIVIKSTDSAGKERWLEFRDIDDPADDRSTSQLKAFFRAMFFASAFHKEMLIDQ
jgi:hypothetical protein